MHFYAPRFRPFCNPQIETGIIYQQQQIWFLSQNISLGLIQKLRNFTKISNHLPQPHDRTLFVMTQQFSTRFGHHVPTPTNYLTSIKPFTPQDQLPHHMTPMQIATGLTGQHKHLLFARFYRHATLKIHLTLQHFISEPTQSSQPKSSLKSYLATTHD